MASRKGPRPTASRNGRSEDQWEYPDVLAMLADRGWDPGVLLTGEPGDRTSLCRAPRDGSRAGGHTMRLYG